MGNITINFGDKIDLKKPTTAFKRMTASQQISYLAYMYNNAVTELNNVYDAMSSYSYSGEPFVPMTDEEIELAYTALLLAINNEKFTRNMYVADTSKQYELYWDDTSSIYNVIAKINSGEEIVNENNTITSYIYDDNHNLIGTEEIPMDNVKLNGYTVLSDNNETIALPIDFVADETTEYDVYIVGANCVVTLLEPARKVRVKNLTPDSDNSDTPDTSDDTVDIDNNTTFEDQSGNNPTDVNVITDPTNQAPATNAGEILGGN